MQPLVYFNHEIISASDAKVSAFDAGFLFGAGIFETILARDGRPFYLPRHIARLQRSCQELGIDVELDADALGEVIEDLLENNSLKAIDARVKILLTPGDTSAHLSHRDPTVLVNTAPYIRPSLHIPWKLTLPGTVLSSPAAMHKTTSYMGYRLALHRAHAEGFDDTILLDRFGHVSETSVASLLLFRGETLQLPSSPDALPGITRRVIAEIAQQRGMEVIESPVSPGELGEGYSVCVCNALLGPFPVGKIDAMEVPPLDSQFLSGLREAWEDGAKAKTL